MRFTVGLSGGLSVVEGGVELPAPDKTSGVLLLGLLDESGVWLGRREVAARLYPGATKPAALNALRQTLFRVRKWLGPDAIESRSNAIRLAPGLFEVSWPDPKEGGLGGSGLDLEHPWAFAIYARRGKLKTESASNLYAEFVHTVESAASVDKDLARKILIGGTEIAVNLMDDQASLLLGLTQPADRRDPLVYEHLSLRAFLLSKAGAIRPSAEGYVRAYRLAAHQKLQAKVAQAAAMAMFMYIECGEMGEAAVWLDRFTSTYQAAPVRLLLANARASFMWNANRIQEALDTMTAAIPSVQSADRAQAVHFWTNLSVLAAEAGNLELQAEAYHRAQGPLVLEIDVWSALTLEFAALTSLMAQGLYEEAIAGFKRLKAQAESTGRQASCWYILEAQAEAHACAGDAQLAVQMWNQVESERRKASARLTPRLAARKARIMRYA